MSEQEINFEKAFARLENILEKMNSGTVPLDDSLKLYEEADCLIKACAHKLNSAEQKIETLIKNRSGELALDASGKPQTESFEVQEALS